MSGKIPVMALLQDKKPCFKVTSIDSSLAMLFSSVVVVVFFS